MVQERKFDRGDRVFVEVLSHPRYQGAAHLQGRVTDYLGLTDEYDGRGCQHRYEIELDEGGTVAHREGKMQPASQTDG